MSWQSHINDQEEMGIKECISIRESLGLPCNRDVYTYCCELEPCRWKCLSDKNLPLTQGWYPKKDENKKQYMSRLLDTQQKIQKAYNSGEIYYARYVRLIKEIIEYMKLSGRCNNCHKFTSTFKGAIGIEVDEIYELYCPNCLEYAYEDD